MKVENVTYQLLGRGPLMEFEELDWRCSSPTLSPCWWWSQSSGKDSCLQSETEKLDGKTVSEFGFLYKNTQSGSLHISYNCSSMAFSDKFHNTMQMMQIMFIGHSKLHSWVSHPPHCGNHVQASNSFKETDISSCNSDELRQKRWINLTWPL